MYTLVGLLLSLALGASARLRSRSLSIPGAQDQGFTLFNPVVNNVGSGAFFSFKIEDELLNQGGYLNSLCQIALPDFAGSEGSYTASLPDGPYHSCDNPKMGFNFTGSGTDGFDLFVMHTINVNDGSALLRHSTTHFPPFKNFNRHDNLLTPPGLSGNLVLFALTDNAPEGWIGDSYKIDPYGNPTPAAGATTAPGITTTVPIPAATGRKM